MKISIYLFNLFTIHLGIFSTIRHHYFLLSILLYLTVIRTHVNRVPRGGQEGIIIDLETDSFRNIHLEKYFKTVSFGVIILILPEDNTTRNTRWVGCIIFLRQRRNVRLKMSTSVRYINITFSDF